MEVKRRVPRRKKRPVDTVRHSQRGPDEGLRKFVALRTNLKPPWTITLRPTQSARHWRLREKYQRSGRDEKTDDPQNGWGFNAKNCGRIRLCPYVVKAT